MDCWYRRLPATCTATAASTVDRPSAEGARHQRRRGVFTATINLWREGDVSSVGVNDVFRNVFPPTQDDDFEPLVPCVRICNVRILGGGKRKVNQ